MSEQDPSRKRSHFFKSFFLTKLLNEGHSDPAMEGKYEYRNVRRWSKKVPGKDIFKLDKIFFPINQGQMHWLCGVVFIQKKKIKIYDSMGSGGRHYLESVFQYLQDEHMDKNKCPLPDIDEWELVGTTRDTPQQRNGTWFFFASCGVSRHTLI
jgi:sentrin-specific protease 1